MVRRVCAPDTPAIQVVAGRPGAGKTYATAACVEAFLTSGVPVLGCALSATAAAELEAATNLQVLSGKKRFVLGASGHIAGVINPPAKNKRSHWIGGAANPAEAKAWLEKAQEHPGSWWTDWAAWLASHGGKKVAAPKSPGNRQYKAIEPAPGRYVKQKA